MIGSKHEWFNLNSIRSYPLEHSGSPVSDSGFVLPDSMLVDAFVVVCADDAKIGLSSVHFSKNIVSVSFFDTVSGEDLFVAQASMDASYTSSDIIQVGSILVDGSVTFGNLSQLKRWAQSGIHKFNADRVVLLDHCYFASGKPTIETFTGGINDVFGQLRLTPRDQLAITHVQSADECGNKEHRFIFSLNDPESISELCAVPTNICECNSPPIGRINSVYPDQNGNINIVIEDTSGVSPLSLESLEGVILFSAPASSKDVCDLSLPEPDGKLPSEV